MQPASGTLPAWRWKLVGTSYRQKSVEVAHLRFVCSQVDSPLIDKAWRGNRPD
jgi:hypothetical protein